MNNQDRHAYKILSDIEAGRSFTQRSLSQELGIALGLTNLLIKRLVKKGYIKTTGAIRGRRLGYLITPKGIAEKTRLSIAYLENTIRLYTETREKIRRSLDQMSSKQGGARERQKIVFYGAGEVAEIAYITLNDCAFELVGVVDDHRKGQKFFGHSIASPEQLADGRRGEWYDRIVVTTFRKSKDIEDRLNKLNIPSNRISFL